MKIPLFVALSLALASPAVADEPTNLLALRDMPSPPPRETDRWERVRGLEITYQVLNAADFALTEHCLRADTCHEANPLIGRNPSTGKLLAIKGASGLVHFLIARHLVARNVRAARIFEFTTIAIQGGVVAANLRFAF